MLSNFILLSSVVQKSEIMYLHPLVDKQRVVKQNKQIIIARGYLTLAISFTKRNLQQICNNVMATDRVDVYRLFPDYEVRTNALCLSVPFASKDFGTYCDSNKVCFLLVMQVAPSQIDDENQKLSIAKQTSKP